jgi:hypothetical protein
MNSTVHSAIGVSPATLLFGSHCNLDRNLFAVPSSTLPLQPVDQYLSQLQQDQQKLLDAAQLHQAKVLDHRIAKSTPLVKTQVFKPGDSVLLRPPSDRPSSKLAPRYLGPYIIVGRKGTNSYNIRLLNAPETDALMEVHLERLIPYTLPTRANPNEVIASDDLHNYLVESILRHERVKPGNSPSCFKYWVKWQGYEEPTLEPSSSFRNNSIFNAYLISQGIRA